MAAGDVLHLTIGTSTRSGSTSSAKIADLRLAELTRGRIHSFLDAKQKADLSAQTVNHLRGFLSRAFSAAIDRERWPGKNPVAETAKRHALTQSVNGFRNEPYPT